MLNQVIKNLVIGVKLLIGNPKSFGTSSKQIGICHGGKRIAQWQGNIGITLNDICIIEDHQILTMNCGNRSHLQ